MRQLAVYIFGGKPKISNSDRWTVLLKSTGWKPGTLPWEFRKAGRGWGDLFYE